MERHDRRDTAGFTDALGLPDGERSVSGDGEEVGEAAGRNLPWPELKDTDGSRWLQRLRELHRHLPPELRGGDAATEIRAMRDERDF